MSLQQVEVYRDDLAVYLRERGYDPATVEKWLKEVYAEGGRAIVLPKLLDILLFPWENRASEAAPPEAEILTMERAEKARTSLCRHLEGKCMILASKVIQSGESFSLAVQVPNFDTPGFKMPTEWEGFPVKKYVKTV